MAIIGYQYRKRLNGTEEWGAATDLGPQLDLSEVIAALPSGTTWDFQVRGYDTEANFTEWSNIATASTFGIILPDLAFVCTGGCGVVSASGHWSGSSNASVDIDPDNARGDGTTSIVIETSGAVGSAAPRLAAAVYPEKTSRFYIKFDTLPNANSLIYWVHGSPGFIGNAPYSGLGYHAASQQFRSLTYGSFFGSYSFGSTGVAAATGVWYRVDMRAVGVDLGGGFYRMDIDTQIDEVSLDQITEAIQYTGFAGPYFGDPNARTQKYRIADIVITGNQDDFPLGPGYVRRFVTDADGVHNITDVGDFIVGAAGANITNATTNSHELIDEIPMDTGTPIANDYINQVDDPGSSQQYVEHTFGSPDAFVPVVAPRGIDAVVAYHTPTGGGGSGLSKLVDNGDAATVDTLAAVTPETITFVRKAFGAPPSGAPGWTLSGGDGNFNNIAHRFGYHNGVSGGIALDGVVIEAEFPEEE